MTNRALEGNFYTVFVTYYLPKQGDSQAASAIDKVRA